MGDYCATAVLTFGTANEVAGLLVNPVGSGATVTIKALSAVPTVGRVPRAVVRRYVGATATPLGPLAPDTMRVSSADTPAVAVPTTSTSHAYSALGTIDFEIDLGLFAALGIQLVLGAGESLGIVMTDDSSGAEALFAVRWGEA